MTENITYDLRALFERGYRELVSITPPDAVPSRRSSLSPAGMGKAPGKQGRDGRWHGYDWINAPAVMLDDLDTWGPGGIGLRAEFFPAVDIDCLDPELSEAIASIAQRLLGPAPVRVGRAPKQLLVYRTLTPFPRKRLWIGAEHLVEILGYGQQYVVSGVHPGTKEPYHWATELPAASMLTEVTEEAMDQFLQAVALTVQPLGFSARRQDSRTRADRLVDQDSLRGDPEAIAAAIRALPNSNELFPTRISYIAVGAAIKAAVGDELGLPLFKEWAMRWPGNGHAPVNTEATVTADWRRIKPPFELGADYLVGLARTHGGVDLRPEDFDLDTAALRAKVDAPKGAVEFSDAAVSRLFLKQFHPRLRYNISRGVWLFWDGTKWAEDGALQAYHLSGLLCQRLSAKALEQLTDKSGAPTSKAEATATRLASLSMKRAVVDYSETEPQIQVAEDDLDKDEFLLNSPLGVVDLQRGVMTGPDSRRLMTRSASTSPVFTKPEKWLKFLHEATCGDDAMISYLQRICGYFLTGSKREHILVFVYGRGGNGKSVFIDTVTNILGTYAKTAAMSTFTAGGTSAHPTDIASLAGARLVTAEETERGVAWNEQRIKQLSSAGKVQARFMRRDFFEFSPRFKLLFSGNHRPQIKALDDALRRRIQIVPFNNRPEHPDPLLPEKLLSEAPAILGWMVEGTRYWLTQGTNPPASVRAATAEYFTDEDAFGRWFEVCITETPPEDGFTTLTDLFASWREWCGRNGYPASSYTSRGLARELDRRQLGERGRTSRLRGFNGLVVATASAEDWDATARP